MEAHAHVPKTAKIIIVALVLVVAVCLLVLGLIWKRLDSVQSKIPVDPEVELAAVVASVSRHIILPQDEKPQLVTLGETELAAVAGQSFFANALPGDKLLMYESNSKAVIWRQAIDRIIEASLLNLASGAASQ